MKKILFLLWILLFHPVNAAFGDAIWQEPFPGFLLITLLLILWGFLLVIWEIIKSWLNFRAYMQWASTYISIWRFWRFYLFILASYVWGILFTHFHNKMYEFYFFHPFYGYPFSIGIKLYEQLYIVSYIGIWIVIWYIFYRKLYSNLLNIKTLILWVVLIFIIDFPLVFCEQHVLYEGSSSSQILENIDTKTFEIVGDYWAYFIKSDWKAYKCNYKFNSGMVCSVMTGIDSKTLYIWPKQITDLWLDPVLDQQSWIYLRDKNNIYYNIKDSIFPVVWVDIDSFQILSDNYAKDVNNVYYDNYNGYREQEWADLATFQCLDNICSDKFWKYDRSGKRSMKWESWSTSKPWPFGRIFLQK